MRGNLSRLCLSDERENSHSRSGGGSSRSERSERSERTERSQRDGSSERISRGSKRDEPLTPQHRPRGRFVLFLRFDFKLLFIVILYLLVEWTLFVFVQILLHPRAPTGKRMTAVMPVHGIPSGSLHLLPHLKESRIARSEATAPTGRVRGGIGKLVFYFHFFLFSPGHKALVLLANCRSSSWRNCIEKQCLKETKS